MSMIPFSSRTYRSSSTGIRSRSRYTGSTRMLSSTRSAISTSLPQWAAQAHGELLAARDAEAFSKLAAAGNDPNALNEFVAYAQSRIVALGSGEMADKWRSLMDSATARQNRILKSQKLSATIRQYRAELDAGEAVGPQFIAYLESARAMETPGSEEYAVLTEQIADVRKWLDVKQRALETRHDREMAAALESGEATLEQALAYFKERRGRLRPGDEAYANLTQQIGNIQNAIQARDFNAKVNGMYQKMVEESATDPVKAKQKYLAGLVDLLHSARDAQAQQALTKQIADVRASIQKDELLADAKETNALMVRYYANDGEANATKVLQFLAQKALTSTDPAEAARYATLASQVQAHERQKAQDALAEQRRASGGAAGPGFTVAATNRALAPFEDAYKDALDTVNRKLDRGITPTQADWAILKTTRDNYQNVIGQAYTQGNADAKRSLNNLDREVKDQAGSGNQWDFGKVGDKMGDQVVKRLKDTLPDIALAAGNKDTELEMQAASKFLHDVVNNVASPFITAEQRTALQAMAKKVSDQIGDVVRDSLATLSGNKPGLAVAQLSDKYDRYVETFKGYGGAQSPLSFDEWVTKIGGARDANQATTLTGINVTPTEFASVKELIAKDAEQQQTARTKLVAAITHRDANGQIAPPNYPNDTPDMGRVLPGTETAGADVVSGSDAFAAFRAGERQNGPARTVAGGPKPSSPLVQPEEFSSEVPTDVVPFDTGGGGAQPEPPTAAPGGFPTDEGQLTNGLTSLPMGPYDPEGAAWSVLNGDVTWNLPTFTLPDFGPEPSFLTLDYGQQGYGSYGGPTLTAGDESGGPTFNLPSDLPTGDYGSGGGASESGGGPTLQA